MAITELKRWQKSRPRSAMSYPPAGNSNKHKHMLMLMRGKAHAMAEHALAALLKGEPGTQEHLHPITQEHRHPLPTSQPFPDARALFAPSQAGKRALTCELLAPSVALSVQRLKRGEFEGALICLLPKFYYK